MSAPPFVRYRVALLTDWQEDITAAFSLDESCSDASANALLSRLSVCEEQLLYLRARLLRRRNYSSSAILRLPIETIQECFLYLVDNDPPQIHRRGQLHNSGWFVGLWTCYSLRYSLYRDRRIWARAYTHIPKVLGTIRALARNLGLHYWITPTTPDARPYTAWYDGRALDFNIRLRELLERADFQACAVIEINRWDGLQHLHRLSECSPLGLLQVLDVANDYEVFDLDLSLQQILLNDIEAWSIRGDLIATVKLRDCWVLVQSPKLRCVQFVYTVADLLRPTVSDILSFLQHNVNAELRSLVLRDTMSVGSPPVSEGLVELAVLEDLEVEDRAPAVASLLSHLRCPMAVTRINATLGVAPGSPEADASALAESIDIGSTNAMEFVVSHNTNQTGACISLVFGNASSCGGDFDDAVRPRIIVTVYIPPTTTSWLVIVRELLHNLTTHEYISIGIRVQSAHTQCDGWRCGQLILSPITDTVPITELFQHPCYGRSPLYLDHAGIRTWIPRRVSIAV